MEQPLPFSEWNVGEVRAGWRKGWYCLSIHSPAVSLESYLVDPCTLSKFWMLALEGYAQHLTPGEKVVERIMVRPPYYLPLFLSRKHLSFSV